MPDLMTLLAEWDDGPATSLSSTEHGEPAPAASDTVLKLDRWSRRRGETVAAEWQAAEGADAAEIDPLVAADAHGALFDADPQLADNPADPQRAAWFKQLLETPEYRSLHQQTVLDSVMSGIAARSIVSQWDAYAAEHKPPEEGDPAPGSEDEDIRETMARIRSTAAAVAEAKAEAETVSDTAAGLGLGEGANTLDQQALAETFKRVRSSDLLRKMMAMAGRMICRAKSLQRQKVTATHGEITGIELSGDVARLVPTELALVAGAVPELETLSLLRLAQRRCLSYRCRKSVPVAAGPIVVGVDESGSMEGDRIVAAKALALAMAWIARQQNRWCCLYWFGGTPEASYFVQRPGQHDQAGLLDWLTHFDNGGTTLDVPLGTLPFGWWPELAGQGLQRGKTDHIVITDAKVRADESLRDNYRHWSVAEQVRTYGIVINAKQAGDLGTVCDRHWCLPSLDLTSDAVEECLSV